MAGNSLEQDYARVQGMLKDPDFQWCTDDYDWATTVLAQWADREDQARADAHALAHERRAVEQALADELAAADAYARWAGYTDEQHGRFARRQEQQLEFLRRKERFESAGTLETFDCTCRTCDAGTTLNSCEGARCFVLNHRGHDTWIDDLGRRRIDARGHVQAAGAWAR